MDKILLKIKSQFSDLQKICGVKEGEKALIIASRGKSVILACDFVEAIKLKRNLNALGKSAEVVSVGREVGVEKDENLFAFASALSNFYAGKLDNIIFLPNAFITKFDAKCFLNPIKIEKNATISPQKLCERLVSYGYNRTSLVSSAGEFALRGDILDVYPTSENYPVRIEFFDDLIENLTYFSANDMKNVEKIEKISIFPAFLPFGEQNVTDITSEVVFAQDERIEGAIELLIKSFEVMSGYKASDYATFKELKHSLSFSLSGGYDVGSGAEVSYLHNFSELGDDLKTFNSNSNKMVLFAGDEASKSRIKNFLLGKEIDFFDYDNSPFYENGIYVSEKYYPNSFSFPQLNIFAIGSDNLTRQKPSVLRNAKKDAFYEPKIGEYVVHEFHGIGKCVSVERMALNGFEKDYFVIEYKGGGKLYLPSEQASLISAYVGEENPKLNSLGSHEFESLKARVKEKLAGFALELMRQYKEREKSKGFKFKREEFLENAFASNFEYELTADQAVAIQEVLADMESDKVMDRLLCGDVGFGKTEVAYRAIFKCVINSKQAVLLCPTTILSEQHYLSAKARMADFGVKIEVLNRFKKPSEVKEILSRLKNGEIDLLIGTHKVLNKEVEFKDLGLLVVDEEQRFGVADKEKIKALKKNIDVLALSATPIPRTLHMSLSGIRDISLITTPPRDRLPIQTYVTAEDDEIISSVIKRELARNGKTFVIYNRVQSIDYIASHIKKLVPEARLGVAHGQMSEKVLQNVTNKLFNDEYDVLVSTTLIENGIDLPSANSMIIFDADLLGLSQLYQLRGRIGRSDKLSYAYLFYKNGKLLTQEAYKRLEAINEFRELGSGFKISMRDLEIRGAGNIFGKEQHGHIEKVGYDMYVKLLNETILDMKGEKKKELKPIKIELPLDGFIPEDYVAESEDRISYYVKISDCQTSEGAKEILQAFADGFGEPPQSVVNLVKIALIKNLASNFDVQSVQYDGDVKIKMYKSEQMVDKRLLGVISNYNASLKFEDAPLIKVPKTKPLSKMLDDIIAMFEQAKKEN